MNMHSFDYLDDIPPLRPDKKRRDFGRNDLGGLLFILNLSKISNQCHPEYYD